MLVVVFVDNRDG